MIGKNKYYLCPLLPQLFGILTSSVENERSKRVEDKVKNLRKCMPVLQFSKLAPVSPSRRKSLILITGSKEEKIAIILRLKDKFASEERCSNPVTSTHMPLLDREEAKRLAFLMFKVNLEHFGRCHRIFHSFCTLGAGSGSGKSRICGEIISWCEDFVSKQSEVCAVLIIDSYTYFLKLD